MVRQRDKRFVANIRNVMSLVKEHDWDWLMVADGDERIGKTNLLLHTMLVAEPELEAAVLREEYKPALDRAAWSFERMVELMKTLPDGTVQMYDEASILGREAMTKFNRRVVRVMTTVGIRNRLYLWTFPDFYMLDPYLRDGRVRTRAYVYTIHRERGFVAWYVRKRYPFPFTGGETVRWKKAFISDFAPIHKTSPQHAELWSKFQEREKAAKLAILEGGEDARDPRLEIAVRLKKIGMPYRQIGEMTGIPYGSLVYKTKSTKAVRKGGRRPWSERVWETPKKVDGARRSKG